MNLLKKAYNIPEYSKRKFSFLFEKKNRFIDSVTSTKIKSKFSDRKI